MQILLDFTGTDSGIMGVIITPCTGLLVVVKGIVPQD